MDAHHAPDPFRQPGLLDPRRLYGYTVDPPPSAEAFRRYFARRAVYIALPLESAIALMLIAAGKAFVILGLVDGLDEVCGCMALFVGAGLTFIAWSIGAAYGAMRYRAALASWQDRQRQAGIWP